MVSCQLMVSSDGHVGSGGPALAAPAGLSSLITYARSAAAMKRTAKPIFDEEKLWPSRSNWADPPTLKKIKKQAMTVNAAMQARINRSSRLLSFNLGHLRVVRTLT